jgi:NOL1/NOP2/fmu family ribosome biogenesis protein
MVKGDLNPDHELAMSLLLSPEVLRYELTFVQAISFLRKDNLDISFSEKGWVLMTYRGIPLGWLKAVQGRSNNYYPKNWRITLRV